MIDLFLDFRVKCFREIMDNFKLTSLARSTRAFALLIQLRSSPSEYKGFIVPPYTRDVALICI